MHPLAITARRLRNLSAYWTAAAPRVLNASMHEVGIMESALASVRREAEAHHATTVERIVLRIGAVSGVEPEALRFAFEAVSPGTICADAELVIEHVPARVHCSRCDRDFVVERSYIFTCPTCGDYSGRIVAGRELDLARIEFT
jgi:hydrogenase nickel incorporation protein HypA/HybF